MQKDHVVAIDGAWSHINNGITNFSQAQDANNGKVLDLVVVARQKHLPKHRHVYKNGDPQHRGLDGVFDSTSKGLEPRATILLFQKLKKWGLVIYAVVHDQVWEPIDMMPPRTLGAQGK